MCREPEKVLMMNLRSINCLCITFFKIAASPRPEASMRFIWFYWKFTVLFTLKCFNITYSPNSDAIHTHHDDDEHFKCRATLKTESGLVSISRVSILFLNQLQFCMWWLPVISIWEINMYILIYMPNPACIQHVCSKFSESVNKTIYLVLNYFYKKVFTSLEQKQLQGHPWFTTLWGKQAKILHQKIKNRLKSLTQENRSKRLYQLFSRKTAKSALKPKGSTAI